MASIREMMRDFTPRRFVDALPELPSYGWKALWAFGLLPDAFVDWALQGSRAFLPGLGTPTALPWIARGRDLVRGRIETQAEHVARLIAWLDLHTDRGTMVGMTREIQNYLGRTNAGQFHTVMCVSRRNTWGIRRGDGAYEYYDDNQISYAWDWDSVSHPERAGLWSDMWIIVIPSAYENHLAWFWASPDSALGHDAPQAQVIKLREIVKKWKAARTRVRGIIWAPKFVPAGYDLAGALVFDPLPGGPVPFKPDGTWGKYSKLDGNGRSVPSRPKFLRFWDF